ncbi:paralemmin-3 isoform X2 [Alosa alosa]|uniref:paralemmin-3 isoform X2 n=1 Tax=Alosa alosa TaxID=278164 RepID=UPI0020153C18|nr:paralemmin-3 isoform X2 [Alosa alosa]
MDEAEKYQQRLQAIAEKRRLQEEQERVKREMEDERIRLQQLKRKSLRDQWLMEGPPLSPDSAGPRSPLWGQQAQEIEQNIDSLQAKTERLTEEVAKLTEEDGSVTSVNDGLTHDNNEGGRIMEDDRTEPAAKEPVLQNGQGNGTMEVGAEEDVKATSVAPVIAEEKGPNGEVATDMPAPEAEAVQPSTEIQRTPEEAAVMATSASLSTSAAEGSGAQEVMPTSNGPTSKPVVMTFLGFSDAEKGEGVGVGVDDDGGAIMRAERVIIMDEGEEAEAEVEVEDEPESHTVASEPPAAETSTAPENPEPEATDAKAQSSTEAPAEAEKDAEAEVTEPAEPAEAVEAMERGEDGETPSEAQTEPETAEATADEAQPQPQPTEGAVVYSPAVQTTPAAAAEDKSQQPDTHELKREEGKKAVLATDPATDPAPDPAPVPSSPSQFQEVPLDDAATKASCPEPLAEQEPLLTPKTAPPTDASAPRRAEGVDAPKQKACQCCSVM